MHENVISRLMLLISSPRHSTDDTTDDQGGCGRSALVNLASALEQCLPTEEVLSSLRVLVDNYVRFQTFLSQVHSPTSKVAAEHAFTLISSESRSSPDLYERYLLHAIAIYSTNES